jgi:hypothetical protein
MLDRHPLLVAGFLVVACAPLAACNALTGADALAIDNDDRDDDDDGDGSSDASGPGAGGGTGSNGSGAGSVGSTSSGGEQPPVDSTVDASGVTIQEIALYQGVKRTLMQNGATAGGVPIVAGRPALMRVFVATDGGFSGAPVTARLYVGDAQTPIEVQATLGGAPSDGDLGSTINFDLGAELVQQGMTYRVELRQQASDSAGNNPGARWPASGNEGVQLENAGPGLRVKLIPIRYGADGSNRLPDTSAGQLAAYEGGFFAQYPIPSVEVTVHEPVQWNNSVSSGGSGWESLLNAVADLRAQENPPPDVYYYGIFAPASSMGNYCGGGCVAGLGMIGGPGDEYTRAAIGLGFAGQESVHTAVHEIGHTHGRYHTPCGGAAGTDDNYPHSGADIGVWGYDLLTGQLWSPSDTKDFMSYCYPAWVSDYTFSALLDRLQAVSGASLVFPPESVDQQYERALVGSGGALSWLPSIQLHHPPMAETTTQVTVGPAGETVTGHFYPYDHLDGGMLVWKKPTQLGSFIQVEVAGQSLTLSR